MTRFYCSNPKKLGFYNELLCLNNWLDDDEQISCEKCIKFKVEEKDMNKQSGIFGMYFKAGINDDEIKEAINNFYMDNKEIIEGGYYYVFANNIPTDEIKEKAESYRNSKKG